MPRSEAQSNVINRVLKAWGLPSLDQAGVISHLGGMVQDHTHFTELLRACEPGLRREMYEAMRPHLRFAAWPLESYIIAGKQYAEAAQLPTIEPDGNLKEFAMPVVEVEVPEYELWVQCSKCDREGFFYGERKADAIHEMRNAGWAWDERGEQKHLCSGCLGESDALDQTSS